MVDGSIRKAIEELVGQDNFSVEKPSFESHGDYATNAALILAKKKKKNPREVAEELAKKLAEVDSLRQFVSKIEVAGAGFINFWLSDDYLTSSTSGVEQLGEKYGSANIGKGKTVVIDYSSPNIARRFSVGHLRSTVIGQALYNLYSFLGYRVIGDNHLGDWGTQFGMIISEVLERKLDISKLSVPEIEKLYTDASKKAKDSKEKQEDAKSWFKKLEDGDKKAREIWQIAIEKSLVEFARIYNLLGVKIDYAYGESFYENKMDDVIKEAQERGVTKKSQGALIIELKNMPPVMLLKSDGGTTYHTRDLATIRYRLKTWAPDMFIYEVGVEQALYFKQLFEAARLLGWGKDKKFVHIGHGLFLLEGKKMSTRKATTIKLEDWLLEAVKKAKEFNKDAEIAQAVGVGAVKYFDLSHDPKSAIEFKWDSALSLQGNSGPYIQYTYARTQSVLGKARNTKSEARNKSKVSNLENSNLSIVSDFDIRDWKFIAEERSVAVALVRFPEVVAKAAENYAPNMLCEYLYDLAQKYNSFYQKEKIIGSQEEHQRLLLTRATGIVLENGLKLLGIAAPKRM